MDMRTSTTKGQVKGYNGKLIKSPPGLFKLLDADKKKFAMQAAVYHLYQ